MVCRGECADGDGGDDSGGEVEEVVLSWSMSPPYRDTSRNWGWRSWSLW